MPEANEKVYLFGHTGKVGPETRDPNIIKWDRDPGPPKWNSWPETSEVYVNNLLAWKFDYYNKSIDTLTRTETETRTENN